MKSLSILLLLGTTTAIIVGALFAVTPVAADSNANNNTLSPAIDTDLNDYGPVAPTTGLADEQASSVVADIAVEANSASDEASAVDSQSDASLASDTNVDPGSVLSSAFTVDLQKDDSPESNLEVASDELLLDSAVVADSVSGFDSFLQSVSNGRADQITGVYVDGALALNVGQQPSNSPGYISNNVGEVTQFGLASEYGSLGLLAHNYLSGSDFFKLSEGQTITLVYGDGSTESYLIEQIRSFEALQPNSAYSDFVDLDNGGKLSASELFHNMYNKSNALVLQTCIANNGISTWGRIFIIATPVLS